MCVYMLACLVCFTLCPIPACVCVCVTLVACVLFGVHVWEQSGAGWSCEELYSLGLCVLGRRLCVCVFSLCGQQQQGGAPGASALCLSPLKARNPG